MVLKTLTETEVREREWAITGIGTTATTWEHTSVDTFTANVDSASMSALTLLSGMRSVSAVFALDSLRHKRRQTHNPRPLLQHGNPLNSTCPADATKDRQRSATRSGAAGGTIWKHCS